MSRYDNVTAGIVALRIRAEKAEGKVARVEALAEGLESGGYWPPWQALVAGRIRAALAEPERDEKGGRCTELTCPQHGPANRAKEEGR